MINDDEFFTYKDEEWTKFTLLGSIGFEYLGFIYFLISSESQRAIMNNSWKEVLVSDSLFDAINNKKSLTKLQKIELIIKNRELYNVVMAYIEAPNGKKMQKK